MCSLQIAIQSHRTLHFTYNMHLISGNIKLYYL